MGAELTEDTIPAEAGQWVVDASVSFTKGCFTGQELVARIDSRGGNVPRHLRILDVEGAAPAPGTELELDGAIVGPGDELGRVGRPRLREAVGHPACVGHPGRRRPRRHPALSLSAAAAPTGGCHPSR